MCQRKVWTQQEDDLLLSIMRQGQSDGGRQLKWNDIAARVSSAGTVRRGKQCRQRWFNQLHPQITREAEWSRSEQELLFSLQKQEGNKWARIARQLPGRSDNNIKNYFYSTLRKAMRRVNNYVTMHKQLPAYKNLKAFQPTTLNKILTVAENKADGKVLLGKQGALALAKELRDGLIRIQLGRAEEEAMAMHGLMGQIVRNIQDFNRICKRRKSKKKGFSSSDNNEDHEDSDPMSGVPHPQRGQVEEEGLQPLKSVSVIEAGVRGENAIQKKADSCLPSGRKERPRFQQVQSQPINESVKVRLPIIPSLLASNCLSSSDPTINTSLNMNKESQSLQSHSLSQHFQQAPAHASNLSFIPYMQNNFFPSFPSSFFPAPFISLPNNPNNNYPVMSWSQQYSCHNNNPQPSPFSRTCFAAQQSQSKK